MVTVCVCMWFEDGEVGDRSREEFVRNFQGRRIEFATGVLTKVVRWGD